MQLQELPLEIQNAIFEELILGHKPIDFIPATLASSYFARSVREAFLRSDACFEVYLKSRLRGGRGKRCAGVNLELEVAYLTTRYSSQRAILKDSNNYPGPFHKLDRLGALIQDAIAWGDASDESARLQTIEKLVRRALGMNYMSLRTMLEAYYPSSNQEHSATSFERLSAAAVLGHVHVVLELLDDGVEAQITWDGRNHQRNSNDSSDNHNLGYPFSQDGQWNYNNMRALKGVFGNPAVCAAAAGDLEILRAILRPYSNSSNPVLLPEWASILILRAAMEHRHNDCIDFMLGDEVYMSLDNDFSLQQVLGTGVKYDNKEGVVKLLKATYEDFAPWTPSEEVKLPPWHGLLTSVLKNACRNNKKAFVLFAMEHGVGGPHDSPDWVLAPANTAAYRGSIEVLKILLERGNTDVLGETMLARGRSGNHPMRSAIMGDHIEAVKLLLDHGATPDTTLGGGWGDAPLTEAIKKRNVSLARLLLECGASMSFAGTMNYIKRSDYGKPSVWHQAHLMALAARAGHTSIIRVLARYGVSPNYPYTKPTELQVKTHDPMWNALSIRTDSTKKSREATVRTLVELGAEDPGKMTSEEYMQKATEPKRSNLKRRTEDKEASMRRRREKGLRT